MASPGRRVHLSRNDRGRGPFFETFFFESELRQMVAQGYLADAAFGDVPDERIIDTRTGAMPGAGSMTVISGRPDSVALMSLVATEVSAPGYLQVLPCDATPRKTSNVNYDRAGITANGLTTVRFGSDGTACVFSLAAAHIVADVQGYFVGDAFEDIPDVRVADTRID